MEDSIYDGALKEMKNIIDIVVKENEILDELIEIYNSPEESHIKYWLVNKKVKLIEIKSVIDGIFLKYYSVPSLLQLCLNKVNLMMLTNVGGMILPYTLKEQIMNYDHNYEKNMLDKFSNLSILIKLINEWIG